MMNDGQLLIAIAVGEALETAALLLALGILADVRKRIHRLESLMMVKPEILEKLLRHAAIQED